MPAECTLCLDCLVNCNKDSLGMAAVLKPAPAQEFDLSRRQFLQADRRRRNRARSAAHGPALAHQKFPSHPPARCQ